MPGIIPPCNTMKLRQASGIAVPNVETYTKQTALSQNCSCNKLCNHTSCSLSSGNAAHAKVLNIEKCFTCTGAVMSTKH